MWRRRNQNQEDDTSTKNYIDKKYIYIYTYVHNGETAQFFQRWDLEAM